MQLELVDLKHRNDQPTKTRGNLVGGAFQPLTNPASNSSALLIQHNGTSSSNGTGYGYGVLFFTNSSRGNTLSAQRDGKFTKVN